MRNVPTEDLSPWFLTLDDVEAPLDWSAYFGNEQPVEIDVGSGRGLFLVRAALAHPETNFLGLEIDYREGRRAARRLKKRTLPNARVLGGDAREALARYIPDRSVAAVHVYFPDPWWKKRHRKRRLVTDEFVHRVSQVLAQGGLVHIWTDVEEYFSVCERLMDFHGAFERLPPPPDSPPRHDMDYQTSFERKKRKAGCTIYRGLWRLRGAAEP